MRPNKKRQPQVKGTLLKFCRCRYRIENNQKLLFFAILDGKTDWEVFYSKTTRGQLSAKQVAAATHYKFLTRVVAAKCCVNSWAHIVDVFNIVVKNCAKGLNTCFKFQNVLKRCWRRKQCGASPTYSNTTGIWISGYGVWLTCTAIHSTYGGHR